MQFSEQEITQLLVTHYGVNGTIKALEGYDELNYLFSSDDQKKYIVKVANAGHVFSFIEAQAKILAYLGHTELASFFQQNLLNVNGEAITYFEKEGKPFCIRALNYLEGTFWHALKNHSPELFFSLGNLLGSMDNALQNFSHPAMHREYTWDITTTLNARYKLNAIKDPEKQRMVGYFMQQFETSVSPNLFLLRKGYVHNDANDYNVLTIEGRVSGLIDFGDMVYTAIINNVAVACTYAMLDQPDPIAAACMVIKGYHEKYPLEEKELSLLYYLIAGRLCISLTQSAYNASLDSNNEHHFITMRPAWDLMYQLIQINPLLAEDLFKKACGYAGVITISENEQLLEDRRKFVGKNLSISYQQPIKVIQSALQYLYDDQGKTYIDCVNNPSHVGHAHPVLVKQMQNQIATLNTNTRYLSDIMIAYAKKLTQTLPSELQVCYFVNSGSEANDLAIRMSRCYTGAEDVIVLDHAYHGTSTLTIDISPYKFDSKGGQGQKPWVHKAINPDGYRGPYKYQDPEVGKKYAADIKRIIDELAKQQKNPAAFICESLLGVGGQMPLPENYLSNVYEHVRAAGGVCIADEVQVGFGRVGSKFWGFELQNVIPDIVVMGKPMGNGHPLAAVVVNQKIADAFNNGLEYFNTYGGNPVSMTTGLAVLDIIESENMQAHALEVGNYFMDELRMLQKQFPIMDDVRGHGLFIGVELVRDPILKTPAVPEIDVIVNKMKHRGFLVSTDGPLHNVLKIKPPMPFSKANAKSFCENLAAILSES
jgi:4-aminobutyrate aminotransferase-like enzyme/Ser/Thr protein kinase RdoA (MazF antagonist)